jgi:hypothetical protein
MRDSILYRELLLTISSWCFVNELFNTVCPITGFFGIEKLTENLKLEVIMGCVRKLRHSYKSDNF